MAMNAVARHGVSIALACRAFEISETCYRYSPVLSNENKEISDWLERLTANKRSWGFGLCFLYLRNVQGYDWNHKRVYRIYCELKLNLRIKSKKHLKRDKLETPAVPERPNETWSITARQAICNANLPRGGFHGGSARRWPFDPDIKRA